MSCLVSITLPYFFNSHLFLLSCLFIQSIAFFFIYLFPYSSLLLLALPSLYSLFTSLTLFIYSFSPYRLTATFIPLFIYILLPLVTYAITLFTQSSNLLCMFLSHLSHWSKTLF
jgi:hypothetical protein